MATAVYPKTLVGAIEDLSRNFDVSMERLTAAVNQQPLAIFSKAISDPRDELLLCYTAGTLEFTEFQGARYGLLDMGLYTVDGLLNGRYQVVWQPDPGVPPEQLYARPPEYDGPFDRVVKPITPPSLRANSYAAYRFDREGGTIFATGPANLLMIPFNDGSQLFAISVCTYVTGGDGVFAGCSGVNTALGSTFVPKGVDVLSVPPGTKVAGVTVSTFRVVRAENLGEPPKVGGKSSKR